MLVTLFGLSSIPLEYWTENIQSTNETCKQITKVYEAYKGYRGIPAGVEVIWQTFVFLEWQQVEDKQTYDNKTREHTCESPVFI